MNTTAPPNLSASLPPLTPEDRALLRAFLDAHEDFAALAQSSNRDLFDLYTWAASPTIAPWLTLHRTNQSHSDRAAALHTLRTTLRDSANPIEQRRAATALLRAHTPPRPRGGTPPTTRRPTPPHAHPHAPPHVHPQVRPDAAPAPRTPPPLDPGQAALAEAIADLRAIEAVERRLNQLRPPRYTPPRHAPPRSAPRHTAPVPTPAPAPPPTPAPIQPPILASTRPTSPRRSASIYAAAGRAPP